MAATFQSPNKRYIIGMQTMTWHGMVSAIVNMTAYASMELVSLALLWALVKWRFKFNIFYLLAFVLEHHFVNVQGKIAFFLIVVLNFNVVHYGERWHRRVASKSL